jgi:hypothetical protein
MKLNTICLAAFLLSPAFALAESAPKAGSAAPSSRIAGPKSAQQDVKSIMPAVKASKPKSNVGERSAKIKNVSGNNANRKADTSAPCGRAGCQ